MDTPKRRCDTEAATGLPDDPLVEILSRIPAKSLCCCKCVSKAWRDLIADPLHRKKLPQTLEGFFFMVKLHQCHGESDCEDEPCACYGGDGEEMGDVDSEDEELSHYGFVDVLRRWVRLVDFDLTELSGISNSRLVHCCNGLLLFAVKGSWSYVVCNPATMQCVAVPNSCPGVLQRSIFCGFVATYLLFDPAGDPCHFNLVQFAREGFEKSVHVYSSKTQTWSDNKSELASYATTSDHYPSVCVNGMLHLILSSKDKLLVLDVEGSIQKIIPLPCQAGRKRFTTFHCIGWSQGCLHYISTETSDDDEEIDADGCGCTEPIFRGFLIWVLEDYEKQQWVLKDTVSFSELFGEANVHEAIDFNYDVVGIHPDHSLLFLVQFWDDKVISYHMDTKEVRDLCILEDGYECITPYVPCFSELLTLDNEH